MKHFIYVLFSLLIFTSCEDKININLPAADSQLAVDGKVFAYFYTDFIKPLKGYQPQKIRLTLTNGYGAGQVPLVDNAVVSLTDTNTKFTEELIYVGDGYYATQNMVGEIGHGYLLKIDYNGYTYLSFDFINRVPILDSIEVENRPDARFGRAPGYYLNLLTKDLPGKGDYYRIKTYKNGVLFNRPSDINIAYDAGFGGGTLIDDSKFVFPIAIQSTNPFTGEVDDKSKGDKSTFIAGDTARIEILSISRPTIAFYALLRQQLTNEGLFASPSVNVQTNIFNTNSNGPKAVGWFSASAVSGKEVLIK